MSKEPGGNSQRIRGSVVRAEASPSFGGLDVRWEVREVEFREPATNIADIAIEHGPFVPNKSVSCFTIGVNLPKGKSHMMICGRKCTELK